MSTPTKSRVRNIVCISDTHFGSSVALSRRHQLDDGGWYEPSDLQKKLLRLWEAFWEWTYHHLQGQPFVLVHCGDVTDGFHHRTSQLSSANLSTQARLAVEMLSEHVDTAEDYFQIRGTEAHIGPSAQEEEQIASALSAHKNDDGGYSHWELWMKMGKHLIHFAHHVGATTSAAYETSALQREITAAFTESGQWGFRAPGLIVRGHTHRYVKIEGAGGWQGIKLPAWQAKTAFTYRIDRLRGPMFGGILIQATNDGLETKHWVQTIKQTKAVEI